MHTCKWGRQSEMFPVPRCFLVGVNTVCMCLSTFQNSEEHKHRLTAVCGSVQWGSTARCSRWHHGAAMSRRIGPIIVSTLTLRSTKALFSHSPPCWMLFRVLRRSSCNRKLEYVDPDSQESCRGGSNPSCPASPPVLTHGPEPPQPDPHSSSQSC